MNIQPLVSIIIPTYNRAHLIGETLDSVYEQTYQNWECIIVDDGSTDNTDEVVGAYVEKDARFKYYHRPEEHLPGGNGSRNYGFQMSSGEYIQWFDSDDLMSTLFLEIKINNIYTNKSINISSRFENNQSAFLKRHEAGEYEIENFDRDYIIKKFSILTGDVMITRDLITQEFDESLRKAQEMEFFTRIFEPKINYFFLDERLWNHRTFSDSISSKTSAKQKLKRDSLIYLSKKLRLKYKNDQEVLDVVKGYAVGIYKSSIKKNQHTFVFKNFDFFRQTFGINKLNFSLYVIYNLLTKKGFDRLKILKKKSTLLKVD